MANINIDFGVAELIKLLDKYIREIAEALAPSPKKIHEMYYRPIYSEFLSIHSKYSSMFFELMEASEKQVGEERKDNEKDYLEKLKKQFAIQRNDPEWSRAQFRFRAKGVLLRTKRADARRFLASILIYFVDDRITENLTYEKLDKFAKDVENQGQDEYGGSDDIIESPSVVGK